MEAANQDKRRSARHSLQTTVVVNHPRSPRRISAALLDISAVGCRLATDEPVANGTQLLLKLQGLESWPATVVWSGRGQLGAEFHRTMHVAVVEHFAQQFSGNARTEVSRIGS